MDEAKRELVAAWLAKAQHNLASARKLAGPPEPLFDTALYHCQQAAERLLAAVFGLLPPAVHPGLPSTQNSQSDPHLQPPPSDFTTTERKARKSEGKPGRLLSLLNTGAASDGGFSKLIGGRVWRCQTFSDLA